MSIIINDDSSVYYLSQLWMLCRKDRYMTTKSIKGLHQTHRSHTVDKVEICSRFTWSLNFWSVLNILNTTYWTCWFKNKSTNLYFNSYGLAIHYNTDQTHYRYEEHWCLGTFACTSWSCYRGLDVRWCSYLHFSDRKDRLYIVVKINFRISMWMIIESLSWAPPPPKPLCWCFYMKDSMA